MKAIIFDTFGPASVLKQTNVPDPKAGRGEVLLRISHTSVNPVDWKIREGFLKDMMPHRFPIIPGWDAAGEVVALGEGVTAFSIGDSVYAYTRLPEVHAGTYAELIALPESSVAKSPKSLLPAQAAAVPLVALTAFQALHDVAKISSGDKLFVTGGAGGVGSFAVQFGRLAGAEVTATAGTSNQEYLNKLGAHHPLDYQKADFYDSAQKIAPNGFDVIFDAVGGTSLTEAIALGKTRARIVSIVDQPPPSSGGSFHFVNPNGAQLKEIARLFDSGALQLPALVVRSVKEAAEAQEENAARHIRGKVVLAIDF
jgi:NADPH2:quinone reductase